MTAPGADVWKWIAGASVGLNMALIGFIYGGETAVRAHVSEGPHREVSSLERRVDLVDQEHDYERRLMDVRLRSVEAALGVPVGGDQ